MERERETTREQCLEATPRGSSYKTRIVTIRQTLVQGLSSEECTTTLSIKRVPLKAAILLLIFAFGSFTVSGTILPFTISEARKPTGTFLLTLSPSEVTLDRKSTRLNSSHRTISYAVFCLKKKKIDHQNRGRNQIHREPLAPPT